MNWYERYPLYPANTKRNKHVIVKITSLLRCVFAGTLHLGRPLGPLMLTVLNDALHAWQDPR